MITKQDSIIMKNKVMIIYKLLNNSIRLNIENFKLLINTQKYINSTNSGHWSKQYILGIFF